MDFLFVSLCFEINLLLALDFLQLPCWNRFELLPFLVHCCFCVRNFHRLWHGNKFVDQIATDHRSISFACNVVFVIFRWRGFSLVALWTHEGPRCMHALSLESCWIYHSSLQFPEARSVSLFLFCKALPPPLELPTFSLRS